MGGEACKETCFAIYVEKMIIKRRHAGRDLERDKVNVNCPRCDRIQAKEVNPEPRTIMKEKGKRR